MDEQSKIRLDEILALEVEALTDEDKAFLRARRSYIPAYQQEAYASVLNEQPSTEEAPAETDTPADDSESIGEKPKKVKKAKENEETQP